MKSNFRFATLLAVGLAAIGFRQVAIDLGMATGMLPAICATRGRWDRRSTY
ncbi:MAG: hypothetical protein ACREQI_02810 [Candidatus Binataceae bacterium]